MARPRRRCSSRPETYSARWASDEIGGMSRLGGTLRMSLMAMAIAGASLVGLPPAGGFVGKWLLLDAAISQGALVIRRVIVAGGLLAGVYVFRVLAAALAAPRARTAPRRVRCRSTMEIAAACARGHRLPARHRRVAAARVDRDRRAIRGRRRAARRQQRRLASDRHPPVVVLPRDHRLFPGRGSGPLAHVRSISAARCSRSRWSRFCSPASMPATPTRRGWRSCPASTCRCAPIR